MTPAAIDDCLTGKLQARPHIFQSKLRISPEEIVQVWLVSQMGEHPFNWKASSPNYSEQSD